MADASVALVLPGLAALLAFWASLHVESGSFPVRKAFLAASLVIGLAVFVIAEGLSAIGALDETGVLLAWLLLDAALLLVNVRLGWRTPLELLRPVRPVGLEAALIGGCAAAAALTLLVALAAPPNNWDAMTYHMARVGYWVQSGSVEYHAVHTLNRDYQAPLASYGFLNLFLLGHSDRLVNMVDWASFVGSIIAASLVAAQLGAERIGQAIAGLLVATMPMAILQASSSQNHIVIAYWIICLAALVLALRERPGWLLMAETGLCLGLAMATKGSAYVFAAPFVLWASVSAIGALGIRVVPRLALVGLIGIALSLPTLARNIAVFQAPLGPSAEIAALFVPSAISPGTLIERALQEASLQLGTPVRAADRILEAGFERITAMLGLDMRDPRVVQPTVPWSQPHISLNEDNAGNLLAFLVLLVVAALIAARHRGLRGRYLLAVAGSCLLYFGLLRFTVWNSRWSLALLILAAPLAGVVIERWRPSVTALLAAVLVVASVPWLVRSYDRPLLGAGSVLTTDRTTQYFAMRPELQAPYLDVVRAVKTSGCRDVGFALRADEAWEYPLWRLLNPAGHEVALRDVMVANDTARLEGAQPPCLIVAFEGELAPPVYRGAAYRLVLSTSPMYLYERGP